MRCRRERGLGMAGVSGRGVGRPAGDPHARAAFSQSGCHRLDPDEVIAHQRQPNLLVTDRRWIVQITRSFPA